MAEQTPERASKRPKMEREDSDGESSSSSGGSDLLSDVAEDDIKALMECEKQLKTNPNLFDTHMRYVTLLRSVGLKQKLHRARRDFQSRFPLPEKLWLEWLEDETDPQIQQELLTLATGDYLSIALWKRRLELMTSQMSHHTSEELENWRRLSEEALDVCSLHFSQGHEIWMQVIGFETEVLTRLLEQEADDQVDRIRHQYFTAMQSPLLHVDQILESYRTWEQERGSMSTEPPPHVLSQMESARTAIETRKKFEDGLSVEDVTERLAAYVAYCTMEERHGTLAQVECIYERAVADFPVTRTLWLQYGGYIEKKGHSYEKVERLYSRATRNCPWLGTFWERRIRAAALFEAEMPVAHRIYEQALQAGLQTEEDYVTVILAWLDFLRCDYWKRRTASEDVSFAPFNDAFTFACSLMKSYFPQYLDRQHRLVRYWAESWISIGEDIDQARALWEDLLQDDKAASSYETWMYYIRMEVGEKHHGPARKLYSRAFHAISDPSAKYSLVMEWLRHEGTARQYANAVQTTQKFIDAYTASSSERQNPSFASASKKKAKNTAKLTESELTNLRRHKTKVHSVSKDETAPKSEPEKKDTSQHYYDDKNTLFVCRIALGTEDAQLLELFKDCGEVTALRHMRSPDGETKGRAYVVFSDEAGMQAGLNKNNSVVNGNELLIQISCPNRYRRPLTRGTPRGRGRGRGRARGGLPPQGPMSNEDFRKMLR